MFLGSFLIPLFPHFFRQIYMILLIVISAFSLTSGQGTHLVINSMGIDFIIFHSDNLSFPFAVVFHIAAFLTIIYGIHNRDWKENVAITSYAGAAIAALHAGDLFTLFVWWEATALTSVFLILGGKSLRAYRSAIRYIIIQVIWHLVFLRFNDIYSLRTFSNNNIQFSYLKKLFLSQV